MSINKGLGRGSHWAVKREAKRKAAEDIQFFGEDLDNYILWTERQKSDEYSGEKK